MNSRAFQLLKKSNKTKMNTTLNKTPSFTLLNVKLGAYFAFR
ncbi:hypothetical protein Cop2CBH44_10210 [Coprobacter secundus subsp. similis]|uniref:Uncharacterized protein n=1 Tax=Coprobacter secundus subsp. similis TaxID=2751153 RepID=A0A7G1HWV8_9BACT|nr:hypothetical protein Cop2CBH44_10210 [Coprobacter secundus subsp. similis]